MTTEPTDPTLTGAQPSVNYSAASPPSTIDADFHSYFVPNGWAGDYVRWASTTTHAYPLFHVMGVLAYAAVELARHGFILENCAHPYPSVWASIIAKSGGGKGTSIRRLDSFNREVLARIPALCRPKPAEGNTENGCVLSAQGSAEGQLYSWEQYAITDQRGVERTPILLRHEETRDFLETCGYAKHFGELFLQANDQIDLTIQQRNIQRGKDGGGGEGGTGKARRGVVPKPCFSTFFVSTAFMLERVLLERHAYGGFASRFFWITPPPDWSLFWPDHPAFYQERMEQAAAKCASWIELIAGRRPEHARIIFPTSGPVKEAQTAWAWELHKRYPEGFPGRELYVPRLANMTAILACIIAALETVERGQPIDAIQVGERHHTIALNITTMAERTGPLVISIAGSREIREETQLMTALRHAGTKGLMARDCALAMNRGVTTTVQTLRVYKEMGILMSGNIFAHGKVGGRPTYYWLSEFAPPDNYFSMDEKGQQVMTYENYRKHQMLVVDGGG